MAKRKKISTLERMRESSKFGEIIGILLLLLAVLLTLALFSHNRLDPSFNTVSPHSPTNYSGKVGAYLAEALFTGIGFASYIIPLLLVVYSYFHFTHRPFLIKISQLAGCLVFLCAAGAFLALIIDPVNLGKGDGLKSGGIIGMLLGELLYGLVGGIGAIFVLAALVLISFVFTVDLRFASLLNWLWGRLKSFSAAFGGYLDGWTDKFEKRKEEEKPIILSGQPTTLSKMGSNATLRKAGKIEPVINGDKNGKKTLASEGVKKGDTPLSKVKVRSPVEAPEQAAKLDFKGYKGDYAYPSTEFLEDHSVDNIQADENMLIEQSEVLVQKLASFKIEGRVVEVHPGPVVTMFEFEPAPGVKVSQIANRNDDLAMALRAQSIRIVAPIPGKGAVGIEVPNLSRQIVSLKELVASEVFQEFDGKLPVVLGKDISGRVEVTDLTTMPHLLVAGTTGSGKSVFINSIICSLLFRCSPEYLRMLMVDPKQLELADYAKIPHLLHPVVTDPKKASIILKWAVMEMEDRYKMMAEMGVRNIDNFNKKVEKINSGKAKRPERTMVENAGAGLEKEPAPLEKIPFILIIIDELSDLMIVAAKEVEESITRLAQMARAAGIHLIMATQRPSVDVITGVIKANFPARISFKVSQKIDSRTIIDGPGADNLLGKGDMLFSPPTSSKIIRIHGAFITEKETQNVVKAISDERGPQYDDKILKAADHADDPGGLNGFGAGGLNGDEEELIERAWEIIRSERKASISYIQRRLKIGYNKAARVIEALEARGFISPSDGTSRPREILGPGGDDDGV